MLEVGYHVIPAFQRQGLASEAARACLTAAAEVLGSVHVIAIIVPDNVPSRGVAQRLGMTIERETTQLGQPIVAYGI